MNQSEFDSLYPVKAFDKAVRRGFLGMIRHRYAVLGNYIHMVCCRLGAQSALAKLNIGVPLKSTNFTMAKRMLTSMFIAVPTKAEKGYEYCRSRKALGNMRTMPAPCLAST